MKHGFRTTALLMMAAALWPSATASHDLHAFWDDRCRSCHGEAGEFARRSLHVEHDRLVGKHHTTDLEHFLQHHYLPPALVSPVTAMLKAQVLTPPLFKQHCAGCHGTASAFARQSLKLQDGVLTGRTSGRAVQDHLRSHGGLEPAQVPEMVKTLTRVLDEVGTPS
jgi:hypothetical protein